MNTKTSIIGLKELRENMETYITRVAKGETLTVMRRSTPIFNISPVDDESGWETVIDFTEINPRGVSGREILKRLKKING
jgi:antitoxin (DNA-binding transcriptional repressor) of toxin-antitoxin stability system